LGLPKEFDTSSLEIGKHYQIVRDRERAFPLHIAMLVIDSQWNFYGYGVAHSSHAHDQKTEIEFEMLSLFNPEEQKIYKDKFVAVAKITGEMK
jgi:hypothetical protein